MIIMQMGEAKLIQNSIDKNKKISKNFRINNALVDVVNSLRAKLMDLGEQECIKLLE